MSRDIITSASELFSKIADRRIVVVEGARCTGKDHLIDRLVRQDPTRVVYEALKPRKAFLEKSSGSLRNIPGNLDIQQSHLWSLDVFRQFPAARAVINRSMLTSAHFDGFNEDRFTMWKNLLAQLGGVVVLLCPSARTHAHRIAKAGRADESESISVEQTGIQRFASMLDPENLILFCEPLA